MKTILVDAMHALVIKNEGIFEEMRDLLDSYPNRKIVLTNADDQEYKKFYLEEVPYEVFSLKHNPEKTDPRYFETMLDHFKLMKDDVVYFEHNPEAVQSASSVGIKSYQYDPEKKDLKALKAFLDNNI